MKNKEARSYSTIEVEIAKNLIEAGYEWLATDSDETLYAYDDRPEKRNAVWMSSSGGRPFPLLYRPARGVIPIFDSVSWTDAEPVRLRDVVPQILTDEEREWLRTVVKPFRDRLKEVEVYDGVFYGRYVMFATIHPEKWRDGIGEDMDYTLLPVPEDWFQGIRNHNKYTPEELGL